MSMPSSAPTPEALPGRGRLRRILGAGLARSRPAVSVVAVALVVGTAACGASDPQDGTATGTPAGVTPTATSPQPTGATSPDPPKAPSRAVEFPSETGARIVGRVFAPGRARAVVLAHQIDDDQTAWFDFAQVLASHRFTVLTFNFEGYCGGGGCSRGNAATDDLWTDIAGAVQYLEEHGAERIGLVGASMGGEASIAAAARLGPAVSAVATLSASMGLAEPGPGAARRDAASIDAPKLFVAGRFDTGPASSARAFERAASKPKRLVLLPYGEHGVDLLKYEPGERTTTLAVEFLERALSPLA
jgi:pimeloyl-ACP methyl ester carboxylesterase